MSDTEDQQVTTHTLEQSSIGFQDGPEDSQPSNGETGNLDQLSTHHEGSPSSMRSKEDQKASQDPTNDVALILREILESNKLQRDLLSLKQNALKLKDQAVSTNVEFPPEDLSKQEIEECQNVGVDVFYAQKANSDELDRTVDIFLKGFKYERFLDDSQDIWDSPSQVYDGEELLDSPTIQVQSQESNLLEKIQWGFHGKCTSTIEASIRTDWKKLIASRSWAPGESELTLRELSYDHNGYPGFQWANRLNIKFSPLGALRKYVVFDDFLDAVDLATVLHAFTATPDCSDNNSSHAVSFVMAFGGLWPGPGNRVASCWSSMNFDSTRNWMSIQHHTRVLRICPPFSMKDKNELGIPCDRVKGVLGFGTKPFVIERRVSIALSTTSVLKIAACSIFHLRDYGTNSQELNYEAKTWKAANIRMGRYYKGISMFQLALYTTLGGWYTSWNESLSEVDRLVKVQPHDILDDSKISDLMFDSSLDRSKQYFIVLQLLRIMGEWISGALKDLEQQKGGWLQDQEYRKYAMIAFHERELRADPSRGVPELDEIDLEEKVISANWEALITYQRRHEKLLLDRIDKKTEEIKSLRDGLFNATSVLETRKGTAINQYLFVFTVITIFYLPLSFVASIFGMHLFDSEDNHRTQASFYISTVLISILTYILSGFGAWWVGDSVRRQKLKRGWKSWTSKSAKDNEFPEVDLLVAEKNRGPVTPKEKKKTSRWSGLRSRKGKYGKDEEAQPPAPE